MSLQDERGLVQAKPNLEATPTPLRFYDPEVQNAANAEPFDRERLGRAWDRAAQLRAAYRQQLVELSSRVSKRTISMLANPNPPLFDADLLEFSFGDLLRYQMDSRKKVARTSAKVVFRSFSYDTLHFLTFHRVGALNVTVPKGRWFEWGFGKLGIDTLLADEVTLVDETLMKHAFVFSSGATITIECEKIVWKTRRNPRG